MLRLADPKKETSVELVAKCPGQPEFERELLAQLVKSQGWSHENFKVAFDTLLARSRIFVDVDKLKKGYGPNEKRLGTLHLLNKAGRDRGALQREDGLEIPRDVVLLIAAHIEQDPVEQYRRRLTRRTLSHFFTRHFSTRTGYFVSRRWPRDNEKKPKPSIEKAPASVSPN